MANLHLCYRMLIMRLCRVAAAGADAFLYHG
jgi:hypothetical protein